MPQHVPLFNYPPETRPFGAGNDSIKFRCANSLIKSREESERGQSGIGLENVTKRLNLLFPGKHDLKINKSETEFEVLLQINFA